MIRQSWALLQRDERRAALMLFGLMIIGSLFEALGVGLMIPALGILANPPAAARYFPDWLTTRVSDPSELIGIGLALLVAVYVAKNAFLAFLSWRVNKFTFDVIAGLSERLFGNYLRQPYLFHLQRNSAELIRNTVTDVDVFTSSVLRPGMLVLAELLTAVALLVLVFTAEPVGALIVAVVALSASLIFHMTAKSHVQRWGEARQVHAGLRFQHLQQGLGGAKDVKLLGREDEFIEQFRVHTRRYARVGSMHNTVMELPRLWLEVLTVTGLAAVVVTMLAQERTAATIFPILGLFAAAAFRLMPSLNRIISSLQSLKYGLPVVKTLGVELGAADVQPAHRSNAPEFPFHERLAVDNVSFKFPSSNEYVLSDVNVAIDAGSMAGIIGESGAGKSTLVDILLGLLEPHRGAVRIDGTDMQSNVRGWQNQIGYVPQTIFLTDDSIRRNVAFGLSSVEIEDAAVWRALEAAQLADFVAGLPQGLDSMVGERGVRLSGGQRQRIGIARALYHDPAVLVLDEATSSLDPATERDVMSAVQALHGRKTIIIVSHRFSTVEGCDVLFRLDAGRVADQGDALAVLRTQVNAR